VSVGGPGDGRTRRIRSRAGGSPRPLSRTPGVPAAGGTCGVSPSRPRGGPGGRCGPSRGRLLITPTGRGRRGSASSRLGDEGANPAPFPCKVVPDRRPARGALPRFHPRAVEPGSTRGEQNGTPLPPRANNRPNRPQGARTVSAARPATSSSKALGTAGRNGVRLQRGGRPRRGRVGTVVRGACGAAGAGAVTVDRKSTPSGGVGGRNVPPTAPGTGTITPGGVNLPRGVNLLGARFTSPKSRRDKRLRRTGGPVNLGRPRTRSAQARARASGAVRTASDALRGGETVHEGTFSEAAGKRGQFQWCTVRQ
jgi:hypothetical protein